MEFRLLGPLEVVDGERQISLGGVKQRSVLALLALARGRPVSTETLIEEIWNGDAPETARKSVQGYVSALRDALGDDRIETLARGYALRVEPGEVDADGLEAAVRAAANVRPAKAVELLREALYSVRGEPLEDLRREPWAEREAGPLEELVLTALETRIDAELQLGEHHSVVTSASGSAGPVAPGLPRPASGDPARATSLRSSGSPSTGRPLSLVARWDRYTPNTSPMSPNYVGTTPAYDFYVLGASYNLTQRMTFTLDYQNQSPTNFPAPTGTKPNSVIDGVRIGAISYSYRAERTSAEDVLQALVQNGLSEVELLGPAIQTYAGFSVSSVWPM